MFMTTLTRIAFVAVISFSLCLPAAAQMKPKDIMQEVRDLRRGVPNSVSDVQMTIRTGSGRTVKQAMRQFVLEVRGDGNRTINVFNKPADVNGVSVLTHSALTGNDKQWLFLPTVGRVKRISSSNRSGAFVGSEFAFEDLSSFEVQKYNYQSAANETLNGKSVIAIKYTPKYSGSGYTALKTFVDPKIMQPIRTDFFNRRGEHFKTLTLSNYKAYNGKRGWRPHKLDMKNLKTGARTTISFSTLRDAPVASGAYNSNQFEAVN